jgi:hypothetical protein
MLWNKVHKISYLRYIFTIQWTFTNVFVTYTIFWYTVNSQLSVCVFSGLRIILTRLCALFFLHKCRHANWAFSIFPQPLRRMGVVGFGRVYRRYGLTIPFYFQYFTVSIDGGVGVCSSGHGGGEKGSYRCSWSLLNIDVEQSILLCCIVHQIGENNS